MSVTVCPLCAGKGYTELHDGECRACQTKGVIVTPVVAGNGLTRPPLAEIMARYEASRMVFRCPCGVAVSDQWAVEHWERGHFDVVVFRPEGTE